MSDYQLHNVDCLEYMRTLPDKSVDAIITDLPYGTTACSWDEIIPFAPMWEQVNRINKGAFVTTASQPFTSKLIMSNIDNFKYEWIWDKCIAGGMHLCKHQPMRQHENILVFCKGKLIYNPQMAIRNKPITGANNSQSSLYNKGLGKTVKKTYVEKYPTTIYRQMKIRQEAIHPTQKPVALYEYLIRTYTNAGDTVLDFCMGSGTTGVACMRTGRNFMGIEKQADYFETASRRITDTQKQMIMEFK